MRELISVICVAWWISAWITSLIYAVDKSDLVVGLLSVFLPPLGVVYGTGLWFDWWGKW